MAGLTAKMVARHTASIRPRAGGDPVTYATKTALRSLGWRVLVLDAEIDSIDGLLTDSLRDGHEDLISLYGVGIDSAAALLVAAGDNPTGCAAIPGLGSAVSLPSPHHRAR
jgi:hypothetical protein